MFDQQIDANDLESRLPPLSAAEQDSLTSDLVTLRAQLDKGADEARRSAMISANRTRELASSQQLGETVVTLLLDHSGSVRKDGLPQMLLVTRTILLMLADLDVRVEVLGHTTTGWKGGNAWEVWRSQGRPRWPGRLCELRHIVYDTARLDPDQLVDLMGRLLRRPDIARENIDGEAILWATGRLRESQQRNKVLVVIGDDGPSDDATVALNGRRFLENHLKAVWDDVRRSSDIDVVGLRLGAGAADKIHEREGVFEATEGLVRLHDMLIRPKGLAL